jgi:hypothetical protein
MPIYRLLNDAAFERKYIAIIQTAFEEVLSEMRLADRSDPLTELVAKKVIELAQKGERDPARLRELTLQAFDAAEN